MRLKCPEFLPQILRVLPLIREFFVTFTYDFTAYIAFDCDFFNLRRGQFPI